MTPLSAAVAAKPQMRMVTISFAVAFTPSRRLALVERDRRRDQAHVGERLREISHRGAALPVELLREEADVVGKAAEALEGRPRAIVLAGVRQVFDRPEAARREGVLRPVQAVLVGRGTIALHEAVAHERAADEL